VIATLTSSRGVIAQFKKKYSLVKPEFKPNYKKGVPIGFSVSNLIN
jgi:hypothetical protein